MTIPTIRPTPEPIPMDKPRFKENNTPMIIPIPAPKTIPIPTVCFNKTIPPSNIKLQLNQFQAKINLVNEPLLSMRYEQIALLYEL